jgi:hypothetical protein
MYLLVEFHSEDTRDLRRSVLTSRALKWIGQVYRMTTSEESHIGYLRCQHLDRVSYWLYS